MTAAVAEAAPRPLRAQAQAPAVTPGKAVGETLFYIAVADRGADRAVPVLLDPAHRRWSPTARSRPGWAARTASSPRTCPVRRSRTCSPSSIS